jgi:hypothetical protein
MTVYIVVRRDDYLDAEVCENLAVFTVYRNAIKYINEQPEKYHISYDIDEFELPGNYSEIPNSCGDKAMPREHYEKLLNWLGVCEPDVDTTLSDGYDPESPGCMTCPQRDKACLFAREHGYR